MRRRACGSLFLISLMAAAPSAQESRQTKETPAGRAEQERFFESRVRPLLAEHCFRCHAGDKHKGNLRLDSLSGMLTGGDQGPAIVRGEPAKSLLLRAISYKDDELKMPPSQKLSREQIDVLTRWIQQGAVWPGADKVAVAPARKGEMQVTDKDRSHWAFRPIKRPDLPKVKNEAWVANPIDAFVLAGLERKGLSPNPPASRQELVRRLYFDVTGLPPTPAEVEAFLADTSPRAYQDLVERLLASPRFGERWARHWLDLVRYAETNSYERDNPKPHIWRYRDYVIRAFNSDKPFDRFVHEQIAGDELPHPDADAYIATGYYRLGVWDDEPSDREQARYDSLDDIVTVTSQAFLGLTVDCARCHDHKIDPIPQKDYYRLLAFVDNINHYRNGGPTDEIVIGTPPGLEKAAQQLDDDKKNTADLIEKFRLEIRAKTAADLDKAGPRILGKERFAQFIAARKHLEHLEKQPDLRDKALCVTERGHRAPETFVLLRGNPAAKGPLVEPGFPQVVSDRAPVIPPAPPNAKTSGRRTALARWLTSPDNPLTSRVMVNRLWQHHFGRGIVRTPNDFGLQGTRPTHPELLDWLASEFMGESFSRDAIAERALRYRVAAKQGWSMKAIHRLILNSNTYKMSSKGNPAALSKDPANDLFWRFDMRRLSAEEIRDTILAASGNLNLKMFGPSTFPEIPKEVLAGQSVPGRGWGKSPPEEQNRRSIYIHAKRSLLYPVLESFDLAEPDRTTPVRFSTTQPTQALGMLNGDFVHRQAEIFAARLRKEAGDDVEAQVRRALYLATSRAPTAEEVRRAESLVRALPPEQAMKYFCLMVLNLNEAIYLD